MSETDIRPDLSGAAKALAQARNDLYSDPVSVVVHVRRLETLLGEAEGHPEYGDAFASLQLAIERVEAEGTGDVDFERLGTALDAAQSAYEELVEAAVVTE